MSQLCGLFGRTRQAWYAATRQNEKVCYQTEVILQEVTRLRQQIPGIGTTKLLALMQDFLVRHRIQMGRDKFHNLLKENGLLIRRKGLKVVTTNSNHSFAKYPNRVKDFTPTAANQLWVSDLTYLPMGRRFAYLYLIMDAYSRKIVGWSVQDTLQPKGAVKALKMALSTRLTTGPLIHHSDRGVQYCCWEYVNALRGNDITISMAYTGEANENALIERLNRTLKEDFRLSRRFVSLALAQQAIEQVVATYNNVRPHASLNYRTPRQAHRMSGYQPLRWYPYKKVRYGNVQFPAHKAYLRKSVKPSP